MYKVWIVEAQFKCGTWGACNFTPYKYVSRNYYEAHKYKRQNYKHLRRHNRHWIKRRIRVVEYVRKEK